MESEKANVFDFL